jgi:uncharacterized protein
MREDFEKKIMEMVMNYLGTPAGCHSLDHTLRVRDNALHLAQHYPEVDKDLLVIAACLHDIGRGVPRQSGESHGKASSRLAEPFLTSSGLSAGDMKSVLEAIEEHPYSSGARPSTLLGRILQDADRIDALGAIGIARVFTEGADRSLYDNADPRAQHRPLDDTKNTVDHFYTKIFRLPETLHTLEAGEIARNRVSYMRDYMDRFWKEVLNGRECHREIE